jgi:hypothetical protein
VKTVLFDHDNIVGPWVAHRYGGDWSPGQGTTIGLLSLGRGMIAGVIYESYNKANVNMHVAAEGTNWLTRGFLWVCFHYPFVQLGCKRVTGITPASNHRALRFNKSLGFEVEATLKDAAPDGDVVIQVMWRDKCRWLSLEERINGHRQVRSATDSGLYAICDRNSE